MSDRMIARDVEIVDIRPVGTFGWTVAVANVDEETGEIERETFALVGYAVCIDSDARPPFVLPCWFQAGDLQVGGNDAQTVVEPGADAPWADLKTAALHTMTARYEREKARHGR